MPLRLVFTSDTHCLHRHIKALPECDVFFHCGDMSGRGEMSVYRDLAKWLLDSDAAEEYVIVPGNHDVTFETNEALSRACFAASNFHVLINQGCVIKGLNVWGSPVSPRFYDWAFNVDRGPKIRSVWDRIPSGLDVLVTHGPAAGVGGMTSAGDAGCEEMAKVLKDVKPRIHAFGHIHEGAGVYRGTDTLSINASFLDGRYRPNQEPIVVDVNDDGTLTVVDGVSSR